MRRFFIPPDQLGQAEPELEPADARHIRTVLRLGAGDRIIVLDGQGNEYQARIVTADHRRVRIAMEQRLTSDTESPLRLTVAQGYLKDKKMDQLVRPLTELGVTRWIPLAARRSVPIAKSERSLARIARWQKLSREAAKQCRRSRIMQIDPPRTFPEALQAADNHDLKLFFWESSQSTSPSPPASVVQRPHSVFLMIGPEGGFEPAEQHAAQQHGFFTLGLGPRILRAETAAMAACTLVQHLFGDMGQNLLDNQ
ncbi:MAG: 16S rRNA (uracil(1498)-N(3))-methyltransferase [Desulfatitalea sp.]|nr:16S rRNA (uracil(1498)-N(3))-methyltransferase [Desulfatitalea sp.]